MCVKEREVERCLIAVSRRQGDNEWMTSLYRPRHGIPSNSGDRLLRYDPYTLSLLYSPATTCFLLVC